MARGPLITELEREQARKMYSEGMTKSAIARELKRSPPSVANMLKETRDLSAELREPQP